MRWNGVCRSNEPAGTRSRDIKAHAQLHDEGWRALRVPFTKTSNGFSVDIGWQLIGPADIDAGDALFALETCLRAGGYGDAVDDGSAPIFGHIHQPMQALASMYAMDKPAVLQDIHLRPFFMKLGHPEFLDRFWSGYSWRRGGINAAREQAHKDGIRGWQLLAFIMHRGRWATTSSVVKYLVDVDPELANLLRLMQSQRGNKFVDSMATEHVEKKCVPLASK